MNSFSFNAKDYGDVCDIDPGIGIGGVMLSGLKIHAGAIFIYGTPAEVERLGGLIVSCAEKAPGPIEQAALRRSKIVPDDGDSLTSADFVNGESA